MIGGSILQTSATLESLRLTWEMKRNGWRVIKKETVPPFFVFEIFFFEILLCQTRRMPTYWEYGRVNYCHVFAFAPRERFKTLFSLFFFFTTVYLSMYIKRLRALCWMIQNKKKRQREPYSKEGGLYWSGYGGGGGYSIISTYRAVWILHLLHIINNIISTTIIKSQLWVCFSTSNAILFLCCRLSYGALSLLC